MTPKHEERRAEFPPRVMVCEVDGPTPDIKCYMAEHFGMPDGSFFKPEFYQEYLSRTEHEEKVLEVQLKADEQRIKAEEWEMNCNSVRSQLTAAGEEAKAYRDVLRMAVRTFGDRFPDITGVLAKYGDKGALPASSAPGAGDVEAAEITINLEDDSDKSALAAAIAYGKENHGWQQRGVALQRAFLAGVAHGRAGKL